MVTDPASSESPPSSTALLSSPPSSIRQRNSRSNLPGSSGSIAEGNISEPVEPNGKTPRRTNGATFWLLLLLYILVALSVSFVTWRGRIGTADVSRHPESMSLSDVQLVDDKSSGKKEGHPPVVAIVGGGLAGLSAAVEAVRAGARVIILEKNDRLGGNSAKASSGINAANTSTQHKWQINDSPQEFALDTIRSGKGLSADELVDVLTDRSASAVQFLASEFDVDLSAISQLGGHGRPRTHRASPDGKPLPVGMRIMSALIAYIEGQPAEKVRIIKRARVEALVGADEGRVRGLRFKSTATATAQHQSAVEETVEEVWADAVILATGGYSSDKGKEGLLHQHVPTIAAFPTTNGAFATGDGIRLGQSAGAALVHMDQVQLHPTAFVDPKNATNPTKFLAPEALRGCGGILVNTQGRRFGNELDTRDKVVANIMAHCSPFPSPQWRKYTTMDGGERGEGGEEALSLPPSSPVAFLLLNEAIMDAFDRSAVNFYIRMGLFHKYNNTEETAESLSLHAENLKEVVKGYGQGARPDAFGRDPIHITFSLTEPIYAAIVTPAIHYCMGGLRFDSSARILREDGTAAAGLYGAGEVTGGLHGGNRLAGNSLLECVVFGRIAGQSAVEYSASIHK